MPYKDKSQALACSRRNYHRRKLLEPTYVEKLRRQANERSQKIPPRKRLLKSAKERSVKKDIPFNISLEDIVIPEVCPVFKVPFEYGTDFALSLDRIIPELGYVKGNIQIISRKANIMKSNASTKELRDFASWVLSQ